MYYAKRDMQYVIKFAGFSLFIPLCFWFFFLMKHYYYIFIGEPEKGEGFIKNK